MPEVPEITQGHRYQAEWEKVRLVLEYRFQYWQIFVYDFEHCEVLHTAERPTLVAAKFAACDFAVIYTFGTNYHLKAEVLVDLLLWERY